MQISATAFMDRVLATTLSACSESVNHITKKNGLPSTSIPMEKWKEPGREGMWGSVIPDKRIGNFGS